MAAKVAKCGTISGYNRHRKVLKEPACPDCAKASREYNRESYQRRKKEITKKLRARYAEDQDYRERINANNRKSNKKHYVKNKTKILEKTNARSRERYATDPEYKRNNREKTKSWFKNNPEKRREYVNLRTNRRRANSVGSVSSKYTGLQVLDLYGVNCHVCQDPIDLKANRKPGQEGWEKGLHIDHLVPISKGGSDTLENVRPAHGLCNISKGAKVPQ